MELLFLTRIDIARIFNSFFFQRQQCFIWKLDTIWVLSEILFSLSEPSCPYGIQRVQQRSQWHQVTGRTKSPRIHLPDSEQHQETLSVSLSTLSASPLLLLVNMHASNIQQNQAWAFVPVLCRVLYYAMIESQNCLSREAKSEGKGAWATQKSTCFFYEWVFECYYCLKVVHFSLSFIWKQPKISARVN